MKQQAQFLLAVLCLTGCASSGLSTGERLALYETHSTPVESFRTSKTEGRLPRWSRLGEQALMVYDESGAPYLLELAEACDGLARAGSIGLTNSAGTVTPGTDSVRLLSGSRAGHATSCRIATARRIDMAAVDEAKEQTHADNAAK